MLNAVARVRARCEVALSLSGKGDNPGSHLLLTRATAFSGADQWEARTNLSKLRRMDCMSLESVIHYRQSQRGVTIVGLGWFSPTDRKTFAVYRIFDTEGAIFSRFSQRIRG